MHLFLDRDGVINVRTIGDYVKTPEEFHFLPGAEQAIADLGKMFEKIFVVTNQSGIGQGIMTHEALVIVHKHMQDSLAPFGAKNRTLLLLLPSQRCRMRLPQTQTRHAQTGKGSLSGN